MKRTSFLSWLILYAILVTACNKALLTDRGKILYNEYGYMLEQDNKLFFIPMDINKDFLSQLDEKKGYRIYEACGYQAPKYAQGDSLIVNMHYYDASTKQEVAIEEKIFVFRVMLTHTKTKGHLFRYDTMKFDYHGKSYSFCTINKFPGATYQVNGVISKLDRK